MYRTHPYAFRLVTSRAVYTYPAARRRSALARLRAAVQAIADAIGRLDA